MADADFIPVPPAEDYSSPDAWANTPAANTPATQSPSDFGLSTWEGLLNYGVRRAVDAHFGDPLKVDSAKPSVVTAGTIKGSTPVGSLPVIWLAVGAAALFLIAKA